MPRGGARPNSGPAKGTKYGPNASTISKEAAREALRQVVLGHMESLVAAQVANAKGLNYLVTRNKATGKFEKVTQERMEQLLTSEDADELERIEVWQKDPSVQAFTDLMNRALDKPKEQEQEHAISGTLVVQWGADG
jgi:hypothetical protein